MQKIDSETINYYGVPIEVFRGDNKCIATCPFCEFTAEVETGFFPKLSLKLAAGWVRHHLETYHSDELK